MLSSCMAVSHMIFLHSIDDDSIFAVPLKGQKPPRFMTPLGCYGCYGYLVAMATQLMGGKGRVGVAYRALSVTPFPGPV